MKPTDGVLKRIVLAEAGGDLELLNLLLELVQLRAEKRYARKQPTD